MTSPPVALPPLRDVIARHGLSASKALGQNFLLTSSCLTGLLQSPARCKTRRCWKSALAPAA